VSARAVPERPEFVTDSEREVWERLVAKLRAEDVVLANVRLTDEAKDHEADLVVLMPGAGIVVVEVKGGSVSVDEQTGAWRQRRGQEVVTVDPVRQARDTKYALRRYVEQDPRWRDSSRQRVRWAHSVVVPYATFDPGFATPDCPRWTVHDRNDLEQLVSRIRDVATRQETGRRVPTEEDVELVVEILRGRLLPHFEVAADADDREATADRLTLEQAQLLRVTRLLNRVEIRGGAGSGKTVLALTQAKELTRGRDATPSQRVALVCYSLGLAEYFKRTIAMAPRKHRPAFVGPFEELARRWGLDVPPDRSDNAFWERRLPLGMSEVARGLADKDRFDTVIVDEGQDFADEWWQPLMLCLRDEESGGVFVYSDENQRVFARFGRPPVPLVPLVLDHNLRNTKQIAESFASLAPSRMRPWGGEGVDVTFVAAPKDEELDAADEQVDLLLGAGWRPEHVALLTTGSRHPVQTERQEALGQTGYWASFWDDDDIFYGHVLGCKGLERRAVVLCVNSTADADRARERLYVGMSRATDQLVVVGDPEVILAVGGHAVARRLGIV